MVMRRGLMMAFLLALLFIGQVMVLPFWLPLGFLPDLVLLTVVLVGFWRPDGRAFWLGLFLGFCQGWLQGAAWWAFALSRAFAGAAAGWLRVRWLWMGLPAAAFCVAVCTFSAELLQGLLLVFAERSFAPLGLVWRIGIVEAAIGSLLGGIVFQIKQRREVPA